METDTGNLILAASTLLRSSQGSVTLVDNDPNNGAIILNNSSWITANSTTPINISISIGSISNNPPAGTPPANVISHISTSGVIDYGSGELTPTGTSTVSATGGQIVFYGPAGRSIQLNSTTIKVKGPTTQINAIIDAIDTGCEITDTSDYTADE
jgi:hypothetical protein